MFLHTYACASVHASTTIKKSCLHRISSIYLWIFAELLPLVHLGTKINWLGFGVKRWHHCSKGDNHLTLPSSEALQFCCYHCAIDLLLSCSGVCRLRRQRLSPTVNRTVRWWLTATCVMTLHRRCGNLRAPDWLQTPPWPATSVPSSMATIFTENLLMLRSASLWHLHGRTFIINVSK